MKSSTPLLALLFAACSLTVNQVAPGGSDAAGGGDAARDGRAGDGADTMAPHDAAGDGDIADAGGDGPIDCDREICNGIDDDCDGVEDEDIAEQSCGLGPCQRTAPGCAGGMVPACVPGTPVAEACADGIDNDCDGLGDGADPDCGACGDMVAIEGGTFQMGLPEGVGYPDEVPPHSVTLPAFCIDRTEVTRTQYATCVVAGACAFGCNPGIPPGREDYPVNCVNWHDATAYCAWAGGRLPTEAEWEYAARGTEGRMYPWGEDAADCMHANYVGCVGGMVRVCSTPLGNTPGTDLCDMAGNVWEWVQDCYTEDYVLWEPDPARHDVPGCDRVMRGGAFDGGVSGVRTAQRGHRAPLAQSVPDGIRCARSLSP